MKYLLIIIFMAPWGPQFGTQHHATLKTACEEKQKFSEPTMLLRANDSPVYHSGGYSSFNLAIPANNEDTCTAGPTTISPIDCEEFQPPKVWREKDVPRIMDEDISEPQKTYDHRIHEGAITSTKLKSSGSSICDYRFSDLSMYKSKEAKAERDETCRKVRKAEREEPMPDCSELFKYHNNNIVEDEDTQFTLCCWAKQKAGAQISCPAADGPVTTPKIGADAITTPKESQ
ncbi:MAG: hypothetical protein ABIH23_19520 [bacterium]